MLTSLVESNINKCYRYFPEVNQALLFGEIEITCVESQEFPTYTRKILQADVVIYLVLMLIYRISEVQAYLRLTPIF